LREPRDPRDLATRDPENTHWQRNLIVSNVKLSHVTGDRTYVRKALAIAQTYAARGYTRAA